MEEQEIVKKIIALEDLAEKKCKIYSRLLIEVSLAKEMETLATRHEERKKAIEKTVFKKGKGKNED
jgi:hypothetical protein